MKDSYFLSAILCLAASAPLAATEVYHWVDENGVPNFSQNAPPGVTTAVSVLNVEDAPPPGYDPEEDRYDVARQAERMKAMREAMEERRKARDEYRRTAAAQPVVQYREPYGYARPLYWRPPYYPAPPVRPEPPAPEPYRTATLAPPGSRSNQ